VHSISDNDPLVNVGDASCSRKHSGGSLYMHIVLTILVKTSSRLTRRVFGRVVENGVGSFDKTASAAASHAQFANAADALSLAPTGTTYHLCAFD
jgi:hypothetical protein